MVSAGTSNPEQHLRNFCTMLVKNDLLHVSHFEFAEDPESWVGAGEFSKKELDFALQLGRKRKVEQGPPGTAEGSLVDSFKRTCPDPAGHGVDWSARVQAGQLLGLQEAYQPWGGTGAAGPRKALAALQLAGVEVVVKEAWLQQARVNAILGGMKYSMASFLSGLRCWKAFVDAAFPGTTEYFRPSLDGLLAWSTLFRSGLTLRNYLSFVRTGCILCGTSTQASVLSWCMLSGAVACLSSRCLIIRHCPRPKHRLTRLVFSRNGSHCGCVGVLRCCVRVCHMACGACTLQGYGGKASWFCHCAQ